MSNETAILAGGCFWGMQDLLGKVLGVSSSRVGYTGGDKKNPTWWRHGNHAEAIEIIFESDQLPYRKLLELFFQIHDPTTLNQQGNDVGTSYRSVIYYLTEEQRQTAEAVIKDVNASGRWPGPVVTTVERATEFWEAEAEHQHFLDRHPGRYRCHYVRPEWVLA